MSITFSPAAPAPAASFPYTETITIADSTATSDMLLAWWVQSAIGEITGYVEFVVMVSGSAAVDVDWQTPGDQLGVVVLGAATLQPAITQLPTPTPTPSPTPAPTPAVQTITLVPSGPLTAVAGQPCILQVVTDPPLVTVMWTGVTGTGPDYPWYDTPPSLLQLTNGEGTISVVLASDGDFIKAMDVFPNPTVTEDSGKVTLSPVAPTPTPAPVPSGDLAFAQAFVARVRMGANIERMHWQQLVDASGVPIATSSRYFPDLTTGAGINLLRFFPPYGFSGAGSILTAADIAAFEAIIKNAIAAGANVILDSMDVIQLEEAQANAEQITEWLQTVASTVGGWGIDPSRIAIGACNEYAGSTNAVWNPIMQNWAQILRAALPNAILDAGAANWNYYGGIGALNDYNAGTGLCGDGNGGDAFTPLSDLRVIYNCHNYDASNIGGAAAWTQGAANVAAWMAANGNRPVVFGEVGSSSQLGNGSYPPFAVADIAPMAAGAGRFCVCPWSITTGGENINQGGSNGTLSAAMQAAFASAASGIAAAAWFGDGTSR